MSGAEEHVVAVDVGGTKVSAGVVTRGGVLLERAGATTPPGSGPVSPLNIPAWRDFPLRSRLSALTALPVFVDNDAKALALGEGWVGAAARGPDLVGPV